MNKQANALQGVLHDRYRLCAPRLGRRWLGAGLLGSALLLAGCAVGPVVPVYPGDGAIVAQPYTTYGTYGTYAPYGYSYGVQPVYPAVAPPPVSVWIGGGSTWHSRPGYRPPAPPPHWGNRPGRPGPAPGPGWHSPPQGGHGPEHGPGDAGPPPPRPQPQPGYRPTLPGSRGDWR